MHLSIYNEDTSCRNIMNRKQIKNIIIYRIHIIQGNRDSGVKISKLICILTSLLILAVKHTANNTAAYPSSFVKC